MEIHSGGRFCGKLFKIGMHGDYFFRLDGGFSLGCSSFVGFGWDLGEAGSILVVTWEMLYCEIVNKSISKNKIKEVKVM